jgi:RNA polymerase sigma-70 factor (ECF subfamily)
MDSDQPDVPADEFRPEQYRAWLIEQARALISPRLRGKIDAEDLVHDTLLKAHARWSQFQGGKDEAKLKCWLRAILRHTLFDTIDKLARRRECDMSDLREQSSTSLQDLLKDSVSSPSARVLSDEQRDHLADALARLPPDWRVALELQYWQGRSVAEVGAIMGCSRGAAAGMIARGYQRLRELLSPPEGSKP